jgi:small conductance mechanosensitive channel
MKTFTSHCLTLFLFLTTSILCFPAHAENPTTEIQQTELSTDSLLENAETLFGEINQLSKQSSLIKHKIDDVPEVDRPLFINLVFAAETKLRDKLDQLIKIQQKLAKNNVDVISLRQEILDIRAEQSQIIQSEIKFLANIIQQLRGKDTDKDSVQLAIEKADQEINRLIVAWQKNIERGKTLDMDVSNEVDQLSQIVQFRAITQSGRIQLILDNIKLLNTRMESTSEEEQQVINQQLRQLELRKNAAAVNLEEMVAMMNKLGMETTSFGQVLVVATGEILNKNVDTKAVLGLFQMVTNKSMRWLKDNLPLIIFRIISFVLIILIFRVLANILRRLMNKATSSSQLKSSQLLKDFMGSIVSKTVMLIGLIIALSQLGIEIGPLLAGMGVMGFVVGFALQDALANFASGLMILIYRPFDIGAFVDVAGISGEVKEMNLVSTTILTVDRKRMIIPNSKIWGDIITNVTAEDLRRIDLVFGVGYSDNLAQAEKVLQNIIENHELILTDPKPIIKVHTLGESSVDFIVRPWVKTQNYWPVYWDITRQVKENFDAEGISIPFPQRDIHVIPADQTGLGNGT